MDKVFEALGTLDELNAALGVAREHSISAGNGLDVVLSEIQSLIMDLGAAVATPPSSTERKLKYVNFVDYLFFHTLKSCGGYSFIHIYIIGTLNSIRIALQTWNALSMRLTLDSPLFHSSFFLLVDMLVRRYYLVFHGREFNVLLPNSI